MYGAQPSIITKHKTPSRHPIDDNNTSLSALSRVFAGQPRLQSAHCSPAMLTILWRLALGDPGAMKLSMAVMTGPSPRRLSRTGDGSISTCPAKQATCPQKPRTFTLYPMPDRIINAVTKRGKRDMEPDGRSQECRLEFWNRIKAVILYP